MSRSQKRLIHTRALRRFLVLAGVVYSAVAIFIFLYELRQVSETLLISLIGALTAVSGVYGVYRIISLSRQIRLVTVGESHPILFDRLVKTVRILNDRGDASIRYFMIGRNTSREVLKRLSLSYTYDGMLDDVIVKINGAKAKAVIEELVTHKKVGEMLELIPSQPNLVRILLDLCDEDIRTGDMFTVEVTLVVEKCFRNLFEKEFSGITIHGPTKSFSLSLTLPQHCFFSEKDVGFAVQNRYEVVDHNEETRISLDNLPRLSNQGKGIIWRLANPKLASNYQLRFKASKET